MGVILLPLLISVVGLVSADFPCTCTYGSETAVFGSPNASSQPIGFLYEYDCKANLESKFVDGWAAVLFSHEVGYLRRTNDTSTLTCPGDPLSTDKLTTTAHTTEVPSLPTTTVPTTTPTTTNAILTTSAPFVQGNIDLCPASVRHSIYNTAQFNHSCYVLVTRQNSWVSSESHCDDYNGGHLFHISSAEEQAFIMAFLQTQNFTKEIWMGIHDREHEEHFQWVSGDALTYTNWYQFRKNDLADHKVEDCGILVPFSPFNGEWDDVHCGIGGFIGHALHPEREHASICQTSIGSSHHHHHSTGNGPFDLIDSLIG